MKHVRTAVGVALGLLLLWLLFRKTEWNQLVAAVRRVSPGWLAVATLCAFLPCLTRVQRWSYVVRAAQPASFRSMFSATQIGFLINLVIPARVGELVRAYLLARLSRIPFARCLTLAALDRVNDLFALLLVLLVTLLSFPTDTDIEFAAGAFNNTESFVVSSALLGPAATGLTIVLGILVLALLLVYWGQSSVIRILAKTAGLLPKKLAGRLHTIVSHLLEGLQIFRSKAELAKSVAFSLLTWGVSALWLAVLLEAFHIEFVWYAPFVMLSVLAVFTSVTVTPGLVGQYHVPIVAGVLMIAPTTEPTEAKAVAIIAHLVAVLPIAVLGVYSILLERVRMIDLRAWRRSGVE